MIDLAKTYDRVQDARRSLHMEVMNAPTFDEARVLQRARSLWSENMGLARAIANAVAEERDGDVLRYQEHRLKRLKQRGEKLAEGKEGF